MPAGRPIWRISRRLIGMSVSNESWQAIIYLEIIHNFHRARMHVPTLENVYQTLHKQHAILLKEREKISKIKQKLGIGGCETSKARQISIKADSL